jgi:hypothetical protein
LVVTCWNFYSNRQLQIRVMAQESTTPTYPQAWLSGVPLRYPKKVWRMADAL